MLFVSTAEDPANPVGELVSTQQPLGLNYLAFAMKIHCGSIALSHGLLVGNRHATIRSPWPLALTSRLWAAIQLRTSRLLCQLALSQIKSRAFLPRALSLWQHQERKRVVMELTGRPSTNLIQVSASSGRYSP